MTKDAISDFSVTANSNTDIIGVNIDEGCPPSSLNNGIRALMKTLADLNAGNSSLGKLKVDNLQLDANAITSTDTNGNITITPHGTGSVVIDGLTHPQADGSAGQLLKTNGSGVLSFVTGYVHPNHSGEVTSTADGAQVIADNIVDEANLKVSNAPTNGYFLSAQSGNTGGLTWAEAASSPFTPVAVTGTTPSLNVGSYNFFDNGTITGNTTVSFASVPTEANWRYSFIGDGTGWDITAVTTSGTKTINTVSEETDPKGISFKPDGTIMYLVGKQLDTVRQYTLSTAWDVSTASYASKTSSVASQETAPEDLFFKPDGTVMYVCGQDTHKVYQYTLSTAWDVSTASYASKSFSTASQFNSPQGLFFKPDGTIMYALQSNAIWQYSLSTAWDVSTASYASKTTSINSEQTSSGGISFKPDGTIMYISGSAADRVHEYALSTAWDITTKSLNGYYQIGVNMDVNGLFIRPDGKQLFVTNHFVNYNAWTVKSYNMLTPYTLTLPASVANLSTLYVAEGYRNTAEFYTLDGGTTVYSI